MTTNELKNLYIEAEKANKAIVTFPRQNSMKKLQATRDEAERKYEAAYWEATDEQRIEMNAFHAERGN